MLFIKLVSYPLMIIIFTLIFQFGTRHYYYVWLVTTFLCLCATIIQLVIVPESANWLAEQDSPADIREAR